MKTVYFLLCLSVVSMVHGRDLLPPKNPVEIIEDRPFVYGKFSKATATDIEVDELLNLKCFYVLDYLDDDGSGDQKKIDEANKQKLPFCTDPSGGGLLKSTGKKLVYKFDKASKFSVWSLEQGKPFIVLTKDEFIKRISENKNELIKLKVRTGSKDLIDTFETVYTD